MERSPTIPFHPLMTWGHVFHGFGRSKTSLKNRKMAENPGIGEIFVHLMCVFLGICVSNRSPIFSADEKVMGSIPKI